MSGQRSSSKSGLFLIELIIAIVFFAVASAICIQLFVKSHLISARSNDIGMASVIAQNAAEQYKQQPAQGDDSTRLFDGQGEDVGDETQAVYRMEYRIDGPHSVHIAVFRAQRDTAEPIYELHVASYKASDAAAS